jgi:hypothetical protein
MTYMTRKSCTLNRRAPLRLYLSGFPNSIGFDWSFSSMALRIFSRMSLDSFRMSFLMTFSW